MKKVEGGGDRVMIGLVQSAYRGGKLPIKRDAIRAGRERGPEEDHPLSLALSNYQL
jgi:hypothetical protein